MHRSFTSFEFSIFLSASMKIQEARFLIRVLILIVLVFTSGCIESLIYQPTHTPPEIHKKISETFNWDFKKAVLQDHTTLIGFEKKGSDLNGSHVLFFGGNAMPIGASVYVLENLRSQHNWGMAVYAYRGYDGSQGRPSEKALVSDGVFLSKNILKRTRRIDSRSVHRMGARQDIMQIRHDTKLYLMGHSLGTGVATQVAYDLEKEGLIIEGLILVSPFTKMRDAALELFPLIPLGALVDNVYKNEKYLPKISSPVLLIHGKVDNVISIEHSRKLKKIVGNNATLIEIPNAGHNDIFSKNQLHREVEGFIR